MFKIETVIRPRDLLTVVSYLSFFTYNDQRSDLTYTWNPRVLPTAISFYKGHRCESSLDVRRQSLWRHNWQADVLNKRLSKTMRSQFHRSGRVTITEYFGRATQFRCLALLTRSVPFDLLRNIDLIEIQSILASFQRAAYPYWLVCANDRIDRAICRAKNNSARSFHSAELCDIQVTI